MGCRWTRFAVAAMCTVLGASLMTLYPQAGAETGSGTSITDVRAQLDDLEQQQQDLAAQKVASEEKMKAAQSQLTTTQTQIADQKAQMGQLESQLSQIALQQYQDRGLNTTALLMSSSSSDDLLGYITAMQQVTDTANTLFAALQIEKGTLADLERSEQAAIDTISQEQASLDSLEQDARAKIATASKLLDSLTAAAAVAAAAKSGNSLGGVNSVGAGLADPTNAVPNPSLSLKSPLDSFIVTSPYGMRIHPFTGAYTFHDGLDMAVSCGTPIMAPANGFVTDYYWANSYGNRLVIDNGIINGHHIVTSYNHLSSGVAKPGTAVVQGQVVALVGTTGASTGCHLHYMIWSDGEIIDPTPYTK